MRTTSFHLTLLAVVLTVLLWSVVRPYEYGTWWMEVTPALIGLIVLAAVYKRFQFTPLVCVLIAIHMMILMVGGHYTYARVPLFDWIRDALGATRNDYDRVGHFAQGFVPALIAREILLRLGVLSRRRWLPFLVVCICLAISVSYEFIEWGAALAMGKGADDFLGTQGDIWDTQEDMFTALIGAVCAVTFFTRWHDRQLERLMGSCAKE
jgi:putative membrane protein